MKLLPAHASKPKTPISTKNAWIMGGLALVGTIIPATFSLVDKEEILINNTPTIYMTDNSTGTNQNNIEWKINLNEDSVASSTKTNGIRKRKDGYWYPTRTGEKGYIYLEIPANFQEVLVEFQVIDEEGNNSGLDPSFLWRIAYPNPNIDIKKQQEIVEILAPVYTTHTRTDGTTTTTLESIGISINTDLATSISATRKHPEELPHPALSGLSTTMRVARTSFNGGEGIYNFHYDFREKNENGKIIPMPFSFSITIPMPFTPLDSTEGKVNLYLGDFFGHGLKITSLKVK